MALYAPNPDELLEFVPSAERDSTQPCKFFVKPMTYGDVKSLGLWAEHKKASLRKSGKDDKAAEIEAGFEMQERQFKNHVVRIENFFNSHGQITDPAAAFPLLPVEVVAEVLQFIEDTAKLTHYQKKKSRQSLKSSGKSGGARNVMKK